MRALLAALTLVGALLSCVQAHESKTKTPSDARVAQMARDVIDAVRRQRDERGRQPRNSACGEKHER